MDWIERQILQGDIALASYEEAKKIVHKLKLKSVGEWREYTKSLNFNDKLPTAPDHVYKDNGWVGYSDWLGNGNAKPGTIKYLNFIEARKYAHSLQLKNSKEEKV